MPNSKAIAIRRKHKKRIERQKRNRKMQREQATDVRVERRKNKV